MRWYQGGIAEAVATSKSRNAVFVVFVNGQDEVSRKAATTVDSVNVSSKLETQDFVAIKVESNSETYRQFVQIYQLVPVPSLFFIGGNGVPLEVIAGEVDEEELVRRIDSVLEKCKGKPKEDDKLSVPAAPEGSSVSQNEAAVMAPSTSEDKTSDAQSSTSDALNTEQKIERAKEIIEKKRKLKEEEEKQKERMKELERRKMGQDVQKLRRWQQDQELKQLKEERQREKAEEAAARERILKQIAQDKAERALKFNQEKDTTKRATSEQEPVRHTPSESTSNIARIQFRLPDGSTHSWNFEPTTTIGEVRTYAASQLNLPFREFSMSTSFPRREFTARDNSQTLRDVQLVPTAVILILPMSSGSVVSSSSHNYTGAVSRMVWSLLAPLFSLYTYLKNWVFGGGAAGGSNTGRSDAKRETSYARDQTSGARRRKPPAESSVHREGNIHRLTNPRDSSDDENNTWNGNSTQQM